MKFRISTYWKCQLIGWSILTFILYIVNMIFNPGASGYLMRAIITGLFGMIFSHFLRAIIRRFKIFEKAFMLQVVYLILLNAVLGFIFILVMVFILDVSGILDKNRPENAPKPPFFRLAIYLYYQAMLMTIGWTAIYFLVQYIRKIKKVEQEKANLRIQLVESEAQALRAQMNPHFIFNSLNSIKSLINRNENDKAAEYLTTFSKLIRTLFQNSDRREVSLYDELETCKLYTQVEQMRFGDKVDFRFDIDENIDLKDIKVPALILQPFIENAIWHGLVPKESGGIVLVSIKQVNGAIECMIDDDGIGRELSKQYKSQYETSHQSKGISLTRSRLELDKLLNDREDTIQIIDKAGLHRKQSGTTVVITFKENNI